MKAKAKQKQKVGVENLGQQFASLLVAFHQDDLSSGDRETTEAVVVKLVALTSLAFDLPPTGDDKVVDIDRETAILADTLKKLRQLKLKRAMAHGP